MIAQALIATVGCASAWVVILSIAAHTRMMTKDRAVFVAKLACAGALGAVLPMLPELLGAVPGPWGSVISAAVTALALALNAKPAAK